MLSDLPTNLTPGWQAIDMAIRCLRVALRAKDMQRSGEVVAAIQSVMNALNKMLSAYTSPGTTGSVAESAQEAATTDASASSPDADAQPPSGSSSEASSDE